MRLPALLACLALGTVVLAGCSGDGGGEGDGTSTSTSETATGAGTTTRSGTGTTTGSATSTSTGPGGGSNQPPTGSISASVNGTAATFQLSATDADGDTLVWDLDFGDGAMANGTTLPAMVNHTYAVGNYTANFTVTDGKDPVTYPFDIVAQAANPGGGGAHQAVDLAWQTGGGTLTFPVEYGACADGPMTGVTMDSFMLDQATAGLPFTVTISDASGGAAITEWAIIFSEPDCSADLERFTATGDAPIVGNVPEGAHDYIMVFSEGGIEITARYETG